MALALLNGGGVSDVPEITREEMLAEINRSIGLAKEVLAKDVEREKALREQAQHYGDKALVIAAELIETKSQEHNNLLNEWRKERADYVTKKEARTQILFYVTIAGFFIVVLNLVIRYYAPTINPRSEQNQPPASVETR
jgi:hypothetical protein